MSVGVWTRYAFAAFLLCAVLLVGASGMGGAAPEDGTVAEVDPLLEERLSEASGPVEVVVAFEGDGAPDGGQVSLLEELGIDTGVTFESLPIAGVVATADQIEELAGQEEVRSLYLNREIEYENKEATRLTGVDRVRSDQSFTQSNGGDPISGDGVGVLVNDSGIDGTHSDLEYPDHVVQNVEGATNLNAIDRELLPVTYVEDVPNTDATGGHGTHVAGIVGATGARSNGEYEGVAPGADLVGYGSGAGLLLLDVLGGFDYALTHQQEYGIRVITNSWGTTSDVCTDVDPADPINIASKDAFDRNMVVVFSAGNSGPERCTITGNYKKAPWVIAAAAGDKERNLADFSSRGTPDGGGTFRVDGEKWTWADRPSVTAPGVDIVSTRTASPVGVLGAEKDVEGIPPAYLPFYTTLSGTSMAAPHTAGVVALMLEANPRLTPLQIKSILQNNATAMDEPAWQAGTGYVNAYSSVDRAISLR